MERIISYVRGAVVLHNYLLGEGVDETWIDEAPAEGNDGLGPEPTSTDSNVPNYARRDELFFYLSELEETTIN